VVAALLAAVLVTIGHLMGWTGVDTAAQVYRVDSLRRGGFSLWDFRWYGGHWTLDYSLLYPSLAATLGLLATTVLSAALAALAFDRLARRHLGQGAAAASLLFGAGTLVAASIGQLTFLAGEAFGLWALVALTSPPRRGCRAAALVLALACSATSPLTGAFLALAAVAWAVVGIREGDRSAWWGLGLAAVAGSPILVAAILFPGDGPMPYPPIDWAWEMLVAAVVVALAYRQHRTLAVGGVLYMAVATSSVLIPSALGGNVGRLEDAMALPLAVGLAWSQAALLVPLTAVPLALSQWAPAWGAMTAAPASPASHESFFRSLDRQLDQRGASGPPGRVEVVPTEWHWEAAWVAPVMPLARGWERQLDEADNPLFYRSGSLDPAAYRGWLIDNGVRFVAVPTAALDMAGRAESALVGSGRVPGLRAVWHSADWRLYAVAGSPGIVSGPARLIATDDGRISLDAWSAGTVTVRVRWNPDWYVADGAGCVTRDGDWITVDVDRPGPLTLDLSLLRADRRGCPGRPLAARS
jgi:hypothetical protein